MRLTRAEYDVEYRAIFLSNFNRDHQNMNDNCIVIVSVNVIATRTHTHESAVRNLSTSPLDIYDRHKYKLIQQKTFTMLSA